MINYRWFASALIAVGLCVLRVEASPPSYLSVLETADHPEETTYIATLVLDSFVKKEDVDAVLHNYDISREEYPQLVFEYSELISKLIDGKVSLYSKFSPDPGSLLARVIENHNFLDDAMEFVDERENNFWKSDPRIKKLCAANVPSSYMMLVISESYGAPYEFSDDFEWSHFIDEADFYKPDKDICRFMLGQKEYSFREVFSFIKESKPIRYLMLQYDNHHIYYLVDGSGGWKQYITLLLRSGLEDAYNKAVELLDSSPALILGMVNYYGGFSDQFKKLEETLPDLHLILLPLEEKQISDLRILSALDGIIVPGNDDNFHSIPHYRNTPFTLSHMNPENLLQSEKEYQQIYDYSIEQGVPVLGTCGGHQHLALNRGGSLSLLPKRFLGHKQVRLLAGSLNHYMALSPVEQQRTLNKCHFRNVIVQGTVMHSYVVEETVNGVKVGGYTEGRYKDVNMAASYGGHIATFQFHPEYFDSSQKLTSEKDPNICILESFIYFAKSYRAMRKQSQASLYASTMRTLEDRLALCIDDPEQALHSLDVWFLGAEDINLTIDQEHEAVTVHMFPGIQMDDLIIDQDETGFIVTVTKKDSGNRINIFKASPEQQVRLQFPHETVVL